MAFSGILSKPVAVGGQGIRKTGREGTRKISWPTRGSWGFTSCPLNAQLALLSASAPTRASCFLAFQYILPPISQQTLQRLQNPNETTSYAYNIQHVPRTGQHLIPVITLRSTEDASSNFPKKQGLFRRGWGGGWKSQRAKLTFPPRSVCPRAWTLVCCNSLAS